MIVDAYNNTPSIRICCDEKNDIFKYNYGNYKEINENVFDTTYEETCELINNFKENLGGYIHRLL